MWSLGCCFMPTLIWKMPGFSVPVLPDQHACDPGKSEHANERKCAPWAFGLSQVFQFLNTVGFFFLIIKGIRIRSRTSWIFRKNLKKYWVLINCGNCHAFLCSPSGRRWNTYVCTDMCSSSTMSACGCKLLLAIMAKASFHAAAYYPAQVCYSAVQLSGIA